MRHIQKKQGPDPLALYVHIPFCETKCPYCDFNTYAAIEELIPSYVAALEREIGAWGHLFSHPGGRPEAKTVFFGGGTPSYLPEQAIASVLEAIRSAFEVAPEAEVTLEANPGDLTAPKLSAYLRCGVNRISIGVQSLDDQLLRLLGRRHSAAEALEAYDAAVEAGFNNVSLDLMYGLPRQSLQVWQQTLERAADLRPSHLSMYCLTLEGGTPMERQVRLAEMPEPDPDMAADMYLMAEEAMRCRGYRHYEISNWAIPGFESEHNLAYWHNQPYLGVGPGAHSYLGSFRFFNLKSPRDYVRRLGDAQQAPDCRGLLTREVIKGMAPVEAVEEIGLRLEMAETLMMGLRLDTGISMEAFTTRFGATPAQAYGSAVAELTGLGLLENAEGRLKLTGRGRLLGNEVFSRFVAP